MKKNTPYLILSAILFVFIPFSCNKHDSSSPAGPIVHKWNIARHIDTTVLFNGPTIHLDYKGTGSDYLDFRADGSLFRSENGNMDTSTYTLSHDTLVVHYRHAAPTVTTYKVEVLTNDSLQLNGMSYMIITSHDYEMTHYYLNR